MMLQELIPPAERVRILLEDPRYSDLNFEERAREIAKRKYSNIFKIIWWKIMGISKLDFYHWGVLKLIENITMIILKEQNQLLKIINHKHNNNSSSNKINNKIKMPLIVPVTLGIHMKQGVHEIWKH